MRIYSMTRDNWIPGIPDSVTLPCSICGSKIDFDYLVDDETWKTLAGPHRTSAICLPCLDEMATARGIDISHHLHVIFFCGRGKTIRLCPTAEYLWERRT